MIFDEAANMPYAFALVRLAASASLAPNLRVGNPPRAATAHQRITLVDLTIRQTHCRVLGEIRGQFRDLEQLSFQLR
jgi:hypothetical protein